MDDTRFIWGVTCDGRMSGYPVQGQRAHTWEDPLPSTTLTMSR